MHKFILLLSLVGFASVANAQDVVIIIEDASGLAAPAEVPGAQPAPSRAARTPAQVAPAGPMAPTRATYPTRALRVGYDLRLRPPETIPLGPEAIALEIERLRAARPNLSGAISLLLSGASTALCSGWMAAVWAWLDDWACEDDCGRSPGTIGFSVLASAGFGLFVTGLMTLLRRSKQRRRINQRIRDLEMARAPAPAW